MMTKKVVNNYSGKRGEGIWWSTWGPQPKSCEQPQTQEMQEENHQDQDQND
jgi:hypothetical protein